MIAFFLSDNRIIFLSFQLLSKLLNFHYVASTVISKSNFISRILSVCNQFFRANFHLAMRRPLQDILHSVLCYLRSLYKVYIYIAQTLISVI